jgi:hypothetical protein
MVACIIHLDPVISSQFRTYEIYTSSLSEADQQKPVSLLWPNHEPLTTLQRQEVYDVEKTGRNPVVQQYITIKNYKEHTRNKDNKYLEGYPTPHTPRLNGTTKFSSEFTTTHNSNLNWDNDILPQFYTTQTPEMNENTEFSTEYSTTQTQINRNKSHLIDRTDDKDVRQKPLFNSEEVLYGTNSSVHDEIEDNFLNIEKLIGNFTEDPSKYYLEFINKNFINLIDGSVYCRDDDLSASFECLKQTLLQLITYLTEQRILKLSDTVHLVRNPEAETR